ncbi:MAG: sugar transferase [Myxococcales bacterium]
MGKLSERLQDLLERGVAAGCLFTTAPVMGAIALLVKATSKGPVLYVGKRLGKEGRVFSMKKFRSMADGAPMIVEGYKTQIRDHDQRLTPIGRLLRHGFDELPQLFNIAAGEMSFVGPRPDNDWMEEHYTDVLRDRLKVRPGIVGLAQVLDSRGLPLETGYMLDVYYVRHRSLLLDGLILGMTPLYVLGWKSVGQSLLDHVLKDPEYSPEKFRPLDQTAKEASQKKATPRRRRAGGKRG